MKCFWLFDSMSAPLRFLYFTSWGMRKEKRLSGVTSVFFFCVAVTNAAKLMGCSTQELKLLLSANKNEAGKESVTRRWTLQQVVSVLVYLCIFKECPSSEKR